MRRSLDLVAGGSLRIRRNGWAGDTALVFTNVPADTRIPDYNFERKGHWTIEASDIPGIIQFFADNFPVEYEAGVVAVNEEAVSA